VELSLPQLHSFPAHSLFLVTFDVAVEELLLASAVAAAAVFRRGHQGTATGRWAAVLPGCAGQLLEAIHARRTDLEAGVESRNAGGGRAAALGRVRPGT